MDHTLIVRIAAEVLDQEPYAVEVTAYFPGGRTDLIDLHVDFLPAPHADCESMKSTSWLFAA